MAKVDLHVHTKYSKDITIKHPLTPMIGAKDCYVEPEAAYKIAKRKGMDFVAITDHDTIEAALMLDEKYPDIIVGEELEVKASKEGHLVHLLVYDINEDQHKDLTDLKKIGLKQTCKYIKENDIIHSLAHVSYRVSKYPLSAKLIHEWVSYVDCVEILNGGLAFDGNEICRHIASLYGKKISAGSDAHIIKHIGKTYTMAKKAKTKQEFLEALKKGKVTVHGTSGSLYDSLKLGYKIAEASLFTTFFKPKSRRERKLLRKILDYTLAIGVVSPIFSLVVPGIGIAHLYRKAQNKRTRRLERELLDEFSRRCYGIFDVKKRNKNNKPKRTL